MKRFIFVILGLVMLTGCMVTSETESKNVKGIIMYGDPRHFEYNGHDYIFFVTSHGTIVHDPDCSCQNKTK